MSAPRVVSPEEVNYAEARQFREYGGHVVPWIAKHENAERREKRIRHVNAWATEPQCECDWCFILRRLDDSRSQVATEPERTRAAVVKALRGAAEAMHEVNRSLGVKVGNLGDSFAEEEYLRNWAEAIENGADW